jgi:hypothetical protein
MNGPDEWRKTAEEVGMVWIGDALRTFIDDIPDADGEAEDVE